jgi:uncharacterized protein YdeI (BOF family)
MKKTIIVTLLAAITFAATAQTRNSNQKTGEQKSPNTTGTTGNNTPRNINNSDRKTNTNGSGHVPNKKDGNIPKKK